MRAEWKLRPFDLLTRLFIASHSSIQSTEANFQHPVGPKTTRSPVDNSLCLCGLRATPPNSLLPLAIPRNDGAHRSIQKSRRKWPLLCLLGGSCWNSTVQA